MRWIFQSYPELNVAAALCISWSVDTTVCSLVVSAGQARSPVVREVGESLPESDVVRRAQLGDVEAFETLYRGNVGRVYALCLRMCGNASQAEELAQEAFVRAWERLGTFRGASAFSTWLHRLTVNVVLGNRRSRALRERKSAELSASPAVAATAAPPDKALDLERAIARLPRRARTVFVLHDVEGYRHEEISQLAGMAVGTSKAHLHRARRLLREALAS